MVQVLFVCAANINRSPMAEAIFRHLLQKEGLTDRISVDSAAVGNGHIGERPFWGTQEVLHKHKISFDGIVSRQITEEDFVKFKYILLMDEQNFRKLKEKGFNGPFYRVMDFSPEFGIKDVPDPSYTNKWEEVFNYIETACRQLLVHIRKEEGL